jgi:2-polyprenyl-3-methyl-5-hydroxy-6-metoxy-1,4-benzoquinol methylase
MTRDRDADAAALCLAGYEAWAPTYDDMDNPLVAVAATVLDGHAAWLAGARVLELGCGTGRNAAACLAAGAARYVGLDASDNMLARARQRCAGAARASFHAADLAAAATRAELERGPRYDVVLICLVLEHVADVASILATAATALAPGGRLIILELHPALHAQGIGANFRLGDREVRLPSHAHDAAELSQALLAAQLRVMAAIDHAPSPAALARSVKLARYRDRPVLLEIVATT